MKTINLKTCPWCNDFPFIKGMSPGYILTHDCKEVGARIYIDEDHINVMEKKWNKRVTL